MTKLGDRGSSQTVGIVTDVGLFLHQLSTQMAAADGTPAKRASSKPKVATGQ